MNEPHTLFVADARPILRDVSLDEEGFDACASPKAPFADFYNEQEVRSVYYPEAENILKEATGAERVFIFDHTIRRRIPGSEDRRADAPRQPVPRVHVDHTEKSGPQRVRDLLPDEADNLLGGRVQIINIWRPIRGPLLDAPLAVCDAATVKPEQLVADRPRLPDPRRGNLLGDVRPRAPLVLRAADAGGEALAAEVL